MGQGTTSKQTSYNTKKEQGLKLDIYKKIGLNKIKERAEKINQNNQFSEKVSFALGEIARDKQKFKEKKILSFEDQLVSGGFPDEKDQSLMQEFQSTNDWKLKNQIISKFLDL